MRGRAADFASHQRPHHCNTITLTLAVLSAKSHTSFALSVQRSSCAGAPKRARDGAWVRGIKQLMLSARLSGAASLCAGSV